MSTHQSLNEKWNADLLRFTGFLSPETQISDQNWWQILTGEQSDSKVFQTKKRYLQEKGSYKEGEFVITIEPFRIDLVYKSVVNIEKNTKENLGVFSKSLEIFKNLVNKWFTLDNFPSLQRIAFGAILNRPSIDRKAGYETLSTYLSNTLTIDTENSSDLFYRINRPRKSKLKIKNTNIFINRLTKWSVQQYKFLGFTLNEDQNRIYKGNPFFSCRLELDINTIPGIITRFSHEQCSKIFQELVKLGIEISIKGDIK